jgi:hypothetical protein
MPRRPSRNPRRVEHHGYISHQGRFVVALAVNFRPRASGPLPSLDHHLDETELRRRVHYQPFLGAA